MARSIEEERVAMARTVERDEAELRHAVEELKAVARAEWDLTRSRLTAAKQALSPRMQFQNRPLPYLAGAFAVGAFIGWQLNIFGSDDELED